MATEPGHSTVNQVVNTALLWALGAANKKWRRREDKRQHQMPGLLKSGWQKDMPLLYTFTGYEMTTFTLFNEPIQLDSVVLEVKRSLGRGGKRI